MLAYLDFGSIGKYSDAVAFYLSKGSAAGEQDRLERFVTLNWFGPDKRREKGYIVDSFAVGSMQEASDLMPDCSTILAGI